MVVEEKTVAESQDTLQRACGEIRHCFEHGNKMLIFGVGGNAANAIHFSAEMSGKYEKSVEPLPCICLCENQSVLTAITNDFGWEFIFSRQIVSLAKPGDVVLALSISGEGAYLSNALHVAKERGCIVILVNGKKDSTCRPNVDYFIACYSENTPAVQEWQLHILHQICALVKR